MKAESIVIGALVHQPAEGIAARKQMWSTNVTRHLRTGAFAQIEALPLVC